MVNTLNYQCVIDQASKCKDSYFEIFDIDGEYHFIYLMFKSKLVGLIMDYGKYDFYVYIIPDYREKHIFSNFIKSVLFKKCLPNTKYCTCIHKHDKNEVDKMHYLAHLIGITCTTEYEKRLFTIDEK